MEKPHNSHEVKVVKLGIANHQNNNNSQLKQKNMAQQTWYTDCRFIKTAISFWDDWNTYRFLHTP